MKERNISVEGMRGIAAVMVVLSHFMVAFYPASYWGGDAMSHITSGLDVKLSQSPFSVFYAGNFGVCLFFVIGGYGIASQYFGGGYKALRRTVTNRFFRLFIPVLFANGLALIMMKTGCITAVSVSEITGSSWLQSVFSFEADWRGWLFDSYYRTMFCGHSVYNSAFWTMAYSLYGAFLVALIVIIWGETRERWIIYAIACIVLWSMGTQGTINCNYFVAFVLGCMIADAQRHLYLRLKKIHGVLLLVISWLLAGYPIGIVPVNMYRFLNIGDRAAFLWHILGAGLMVLTIINFEESGRILGSRGMQFLGRISFSVYLIHMQVLGSFSTYLFQKMFESGISYSLSFIVVVALSAALIVSIGWLIYEIAERKLNEILNNIYFRVFKSEKIVKN